MNYTKRAYDYSKLRGRIAEKLDNLKAYAEALNISETALYNKLQNKVPFKQDEMLDSIKILEIDPEEIILYFFTLKVGKNQTK